MGNEQSHEKKLQSVTSTTETTTAAAIATEVIKENDDKKNTNTNKSSETAAEWVTYKAKTRQSVNSKSTATTTTATTTTTTTSANTSNNKTKKENKSTTTATAKRLDYDEDSQEDDDDDDNDEDDMTGSLLVGSLDDSFFANLTTTSITNHNDQPVVAKSKYSRISTDVLARHHLALTALGLTCARLKDAQTQLQQTNNNNNNNTLHLDFPMKWKDLQSQFKKQQNNGTLTPIQEDDHRPYPSDIWDLWNKWQNNDANITTTNSNKKTSPNLILDQDLVICSVKCDALHEFAYAIFFLPQYATVTVVFGGLDHQQRRRGQGMTPLLLRNKNSSNTGTKKTTKQNRKSRKKQLKRSAQAKNKPQELENEVGIDGYWGDAILGANATLLKEISKELQFLKYNFHHVTFAGYNGGGALAKIMGLWSVTAQTKHFRNPTFPLPIQVYSYGAPRVGDKAFAKVHKAYENQSPQALQHFRFVHQTDWTPSFPIVVWDDIEGYKTAGMTVMLSSPPLPPTLSPSSCVLDTYWEALKSWQAPASTQGWYRAEKEKLIDQANHQRRRWIVFVCLLLVYGPIVYLWTYPPFDITTMSTNTNTTAIENDNDNNSNNMTNETRTLTETKMSMMASSSDRDYDNTIPVKDALVHEQGGDNDHANDEEVIVAATTITATVTDSVAADESENEDIEVTDAEDASMEKGDQEEDEETEVVNSSTSTTTTTESIEEENNSELTVDSDTVDDATASLEEEDEISDQDNDEEEELVDSSTATATSESIKDDSDDQQKEDADDVVESTTTTATTESIDYESDDQENEDDDNVVESTATTATSESIEDESDDQKEQDADDVVESTATTATSESVDDKNTTTAATSVTPLTSEKGEETTENEEPTEQNTGPESADTVKLSRMTLGSSRPIVSSAVPGNVPTNSDACASNECSTNVREEESSHASESKEDEAITHDDADILIDSTNELRGSENGTNTAPNEASNDQQNKTVSTLEDQVSLEQQKPKPKSVLTIGSVDLFKRSNIFRTRRSLKESSDLDWAFGWIASKGRQSEVETVFSRWETEIWFQNNVADKQHIKAETMRVLNNARAKAAASIK